MISRAILPSSMLRAVGPYQLVDYVHLSVSGPFKTAADIREPAAPDEY